MLSEKAKGKQRAVDQIIDTHDQPDSVTKELIIRFTEGLPDLTLCVNEHDAVRDVKRMIRTSSLDVQRRRLRLIHAGRLLSDGTLVHTLFGKRASSSESAVTRRDSAEGEVYDTTTWVHCSVGPQIEAGEEDEEMKEQTAQLKPLRGFDRLSAAGFSEQDIANIRLQFHTHSAGDYLDHDFTNEEDLDEHARQLEEQWIDSLDNTGSAVLSSASRTSSVLLNGIVLGFFFPLLLFFFFREPKPAVFWDDGSECESTGGFVFSRRMQVGIVVGFGLNVIFGIWTYMLASP